MAEETKKKLNNAETSIKNEAESSASNIEKVSKKTLSGIVVSSAMQDTIVVAVSRYVKHRKYKKYQKRMKKYHVHDKGNTFEVGDKVEIVETAPISKTKKFIVVTK